MNDKNMQDEPKRWRHWSRVPPDPDHTTIEVQTGNGSRHHAYIINESVEGLALLFSHADRLRVGDVLDVRTSEGQRRAVITYVEQHGMFFRVGLAYGDRVDHAAAKATE